MNAPTPNSREKNAKTMEARNLESLVREKNELQAENNQLTLRVKELEATVQALWRGGGNRSNLTSPQPGIVEALQEEKQVLEEAYNKMAAELGALKAQQAEFEAEKARNLELSTQVDRLGQQLAREILAHQNAERALAEARAKLASAPRNQQPIPMPPTPTTGNAPGMAGGGQAPKPAVPPRAESPRPAAFTAPAPNTSIPGPAPAPANSQGANPHLVVRSLVGDLAKPGTGTLPAAVAETLSGMKRSLTYFVRHTSSTEVLDELCGSIDFVTRETAKSGILNLHQIATALRLLLQDLKGTQSLLNTTILRTLGQAIDFVSLLAGNVKKVRDLAPVKVLAVDDEDLVLEVLANQLKSIEIELRTTSSPSQAIPLLKRQRYNLLLLDIAMDEINGLDLCSQIRTLPYYSRTPIVFITGMKTLEMRAQSSLVGGSDFISKPFHASEIKLKTIYWALKDQMASL